MLRLLVLTSLVAASLGADLTFKDCGSTATIESVALNPCTTNPCEIHLAQTYTGTITLTPRAASHTPTNNCTGFVVTTFSSTEMPFGECKNGDPCQQGLNCPLTPNVKQTYNPVITAPTNATVNLRYIAKWTLVGDHGENIACFEFPVVLKA